MLWKGRGVEIFLTLLAFGGTHVEQSQLGGHRVGLWPLLAIHPLCQGVATRNCNFATLSDFSMTTPTSAREEGGGGWQHAHGPAVVTFVTGI